MKHKLFIFCIILFSLNTILLGNLSNEFLDYIDDEEIENIYLDITNEPQTVDFDLALDNEIVKSTAHITLDVGLLKDLININILCEDYGAKYKIILYYGNNDIIYNYEISGQYSTQLQTIDYPEIDKFYINITIETTESYFYDEIYSFTISASSEKYDFDKIKDNDEIIITNYN